jgi:hypothetical protein
MTELRFEHDPKKAAENLRKHGVTFEEAATTFFDTNGASWYDEDPSNLVILDAALMPYFPDSESVNRALQAFLAINDQVKSVAKPLRSRGRRAATATPRVRSTSWHGTSGRVTLGFAFLMQMTILPVLT